MSSKHADSIPGFGVDCYFTPSFLTGSTPMLVAMSSDRRSHLLPVRRVLATVGVVGALAGGAIATAAAVDRPEQEFASASLAASPMISAGFGAVDAISSGS